MLEHKKILVGITGSIAAYKTILLVRELVKAGALIAAEIDRLNRANTRSQPHAEDNA